MDNPLLSTKQKKERLKELPRLIRVAGRDQPAGQVWRAALAQGTWPVRARGAGSTVDAPPAEEDYALVDLNLAVEAVPPGETVPEPPAQVGYGGLTPRQRELFLRWLADPTAPAPAAFRRLYLAHLEVRLFEGEPFQQEAHQALLHLAASPAWTGHEELARVLLLSFWLRQDGAGLARWLTQGTLPGSLWGLALGHQALMGEGLGVEILAAVAAIWELPNAHLAPELLTFRLNSLASTLGQDPLQYALSQLSADALAPRPWRSVHRALRLALPQPDLQPVLEPLLREQFGLVDVEIAPAEEAKANPVSPENQEEKAQRSSDRWQLILEFGHSRSEYFHHVLSQSQRLPGFTQILDENRRLVYRVVFTKSEMRRFWRLWDYVQNWTSTRVYLNGEEVEKWKVWPYSQYLR